MGFFDKNDNCTIADALKELLNRTDREIFSYVMLRSIGLLDNTSLQATHSHHPITVQDSGAMATIPLHPTHRSETTPSFMKTYGKELDFKDDKVKTHGHDDGGNQPQIPPRTHHGQ